jgi:4-diphosphocytidyl-2-C-methyl-D-erythritol kinase
MPGSQEVRRAVVPSLAKVNLDLRVLYKREDGFHELRTVFQTISLADRIRIECTPGTAKTRLSIAGNVEIPDNLILRAAEAVMRAARAKGEIRFELDKQIPMGGGLGGGSSNAAAVLLALPVLLGKTLSAAKLHELAAELGSDVPFFLYGGTALGLGRGTELYTLADSAPVRGLLVIPQVHVSTADAYRALERATHGAASARYLDAAHWPTGGVNDFEAPVFAKHPELRRIARRLKASGATVVRMSGSGSSIFSVFSDAAAEAHAMQQLEGLPVHRMTFITRRQYQRLWWNCLKRHTLVKIWPPQSRYER